MLILTEDIYALVFSGKKTLKNLKLYDKIGDIVKVIGSDHGNMVIVNNGKESFSVLKTQLRYEEEDLRETQTTQV